MWRVTRHQAAIAFHCSTLSLMVWMIGLLWIFPASLLAQAPAWWTNRNVIATNAVPNDFAAINQGQVKWLATQATEEFVANGLTSSNITALVASFTHNNNYRPVNNGQLKNVAKPFYDCLYGLNLTNCYPAGAGTPYPWSNSTKPPKDYALANVGQAKYLFSFDLTSAGFSTLGDGIPDWWKLKYSFLAITPADTLTDDGQTLL